MSEIFTMRGTTQEIKGLQQLVSFVYGSTLSKELLTAVEIGSYAGESMEIMANTCKIAHIACIDPWKSGWDDNDKSSSTDLVFAEKLFDARAARAMSIHDINIVKLKCSFEELISSNSYDAVLNPDFVYVDACNKYESVKYMLQACVRTIKPKVAICGHDYSGYWNGVQKAVDEVLGKPDIVFCDTSWCKLLVDC